MTPAGGRLVAGLTVLAGFVAGLALVASRADAAPEAPQQCATNDVRLTCGYTVETPAAPAPTEGRDRPARPAGHPAVGQPTGVWSSEPLNIRAMSGDASPAGLDSCTTPGGQPGVRYRNTLLGPTGEVLDTSITCVGDAAPEPAPGAPPEPVLPPPPPTREELIASAPVPQPVIRRNPADRGLTGLSSRFWASVGTTVEASVTVRGWTVTGTLGAGSLDWDTGDGGRYTTPSPGSADRPAIEHTYERDGTWAVSVDMAWSGSYTIAGYGTSFTVDGLTATGTAALDYEVVEVRGVLDDPGA